MGVSWWVVVNLAWGGDGDGDGEVGVGVLTEQNWEEAGSSGRHEVGGYVI